MRLFFAIDIPADPVFSRLYQELNTISKHLKPVDPLRQHVTLKFLGDPNVGQKDVIDAVEKVGPKHAPFELVVKDPGAFSSWRSPTVLWLGLSPKDALGSLAKDIDSYLHERIGTEIEKRDFRAHITIARYKSREKFDSISAKEWMEKAVLDLDSKNYTIPIEEFHLIDSTLTSKGPIYRKVSSFSLEG